MILPTLAISARSCPTGLASPGHSNWCLITVNEKCSSFVCQLGVTCLTTINFHWWLTICRFMTFVSVRLVLLHLVCSLSQHLLDLLLVLVVMFFLGRNAVFCYIHYGSLLLCEWIIFDNGRLLRSFQGIITDCQSCAVQSVNGLLMIRYGNFVKQFSDGTSLSKYDSHTCYCMLWRTVYLIFFRAFLSFSVILLLFCWRIYFMFLRYQF